MKIDSISNEMKEFHEKIKPIQALLGGTEAMRAAKQTYLPKFKSETTQDYNARLAVATLTPYFEDTIKSMAGRVFYRQFALDDVHDEVREFVEDFNGSGKSMSGIFESVFFESLGYSRSYVVIDYTLTEQAKTREEEKNLNARPYAFKVSPDQVLDIRKSNGGIVLFKYIHTVIDEEHTNDFEIKYQDEIVLMTPARTRFYRKLSGNDWTLVKDVEIRVGNKAYDHVFVEELKLAKKPPLSNLAELNIKHWQSQSEQDNILSKARMPILKMMGVDQPASEDELIIAGALFLPLGGDASYIEHSGAAIKAGQEALNKLEEQMAVAGSKLLMRTKMALTDSQTKNESKKEVSELMLYSLKLNDFMNHVLDKFGLWLGLDDAGSIDITDNLQKTIESEISISELIQSVNHAIISKKSVFEAMVAWNAITDNRTFEEEQEQIALEQISEIAAPMA
ncbi:DUF4055 domain-containing protein [Wohlfahrtiimonas chitiniclastica]|uniref:DUF4055 domain-containing protein n=1 Tax=Wohlfahrtiimonas chitiniclastica TaxID=400946 RepID=UPI001BCB8F3B|nr:DUF4055 domain-containing protein [Wohlfahrtiimonas chitiniclastica]MBS7835158.1 DUF4055 domain-containing protein [Wohlfahrtiimonas chitiniclastica]